MHRLLLAPKVTVKSECPEPSRNLSLGRDFAYKVGLVWSLVKVCLLSYWEASVLPLKLPGVIFHLFYLTFCTTHVWWYILSVNWGSFACFFAFISANSFFSISAWLGIHSTVIVFPVWSHPFAKLLNCMKVSWLEPLGIWLEFQATNQ